MGQFDPPSPVVTFDFPTWTALYPEFSNCSSAQGQAWFDRACLYFDNSPCNPAVRVGATVFGQLLYMLTSHVGWLAAPRDAKGQPASAGSPPNQQVGRISNASEGSVSVGLDFPSSGSPSEAWYLQTRYGAEFWAATAQFRTMRYLARPRFVPSAIFPFFPPWGR